MSLVCGGDRVSVVSSGGFGSWMADGWVGAVGWWVDAVGCAVCDIVRGRGVAMVIGRWVYTK